MGDPFGLLTAQDHAVQQNYAASQRQGYSHWVNVQGDQYKAVSKKGNFLDKKKTPQAFYAIEAYKNGIHVWIRDVSKEQYEQSRKEGSLFGMDWFPWSTKVVAGNGEAKGHYFARHLYGKKATIPFNEWSGELLYMKLQTIAMLSALGVASYYGGMYAYRRLN